MKEQSELSTKSTGLNDFARDYRIRHEIREAKSDDAERKSIWEFIFRCETCPAFCELRVLAKELPSTPRYCPYVGAAGWKMVGKKEVRIVRCDETEEGEE